jgi:hypothetical protein
MSLYSLPLARSGLRDRQERFDVWHFDALRSAAWSKLPFLFGFSRRLDAPLYHLGSVPFIDGWGRGARSGSHQAEEPRPSLA